MCVIVDADVSVRVLLEVDDPDYGLMRRALFGDAIPRARIVYGGKLLTVEYKRSARILGAIAALDRAGRARRVPDELVNEIEAIVCAEGACVSQDTHVVALARASRARLLCTMDGALSTDFTNPAVVNAPRGKVYTRHAHLQLLSECCKRVFRQPRRRQRRSR